VLLCIARVLILQAPALAPGRYLGNAAEHEQRHLGTAGADQSLATAPPGGDKLHRLMMQAMLPRTTDDGKG